MNTRERIRASEQLTDADIQGIEGATKALFELIRKFNYGLIPYEQMERVAGKRAPARLWDLKRLGFIRDYEKVKRKGSRVFDYRAIPYSESGKQLQLIQVQQTKTFEW
jgi:hypothetical protein